MVMKLNTAIIVAFVAFAASCAEKPKGPVSPKSAVIVIENMYSRQGIATSSAISIVNRKTIQKLEAFFPKYRETPSSNMASGWEHGYTVYFNFPNGKTLRIVVSYNGGGDTWTMVGGDLKTNGEFKEFVEALRRKKPREQGSSSGRDEDAAQE